MRLMLLLSCLTLVAGCSDEPSFDERYNAQSDTLEGAAMNIENEMRNRMVVSNTIGREPPGPDRKK